MGLHHSIDVPHVLGRNQGHMAISTFHWLLRIIERTRPLPGNAAGLPVVIVVESPNPPVAVHGNIQMDLVAGGAQFRSVFSMKRLQENLPMRLGSHLDEKIMDPLQELVITGGKVMQGRIFNDKCAIPHAVPDLDYGMTRCASQPGLSLGSMKLLFDGNIELSVEEHRVVMTSRTPFGWLDSYYVLHVLDRLAVPLIIERGEVVH
jgi:hypothetical protein